MRIHHVNLGLHAEDLPAQRSFLVEVLGCRVLEPGPEMADLEVHWFEVGDGGQIHLSIDPEHRPAARAHVAVECSARQLDVIEERLGSADHEIDVRAGRTCRVIFVDDPAGNRWELRGPER